MKPTLYKRLIEDIDSFMARDPAARSRWEVVLCYPGYHALMGYRVSSALWRLNWRLLARFLSNISKILSGIEIHPGATIGRRFFIDHGTGVVIGETSEIGDDVMLYQGVTLGGTSLEKGKRHPTLEDGVVVGSGAQVLGPVTVGRNALVRANAVVVKDVPENCTVVGIPAQPVATSSCSPNQFSAYGTPTDDIPDPDAKAMGAMLNEISTLRMRVQELERELEERIQLRLASAEEESDSDEPTASY